MKFLSFLSMILLVFSCGQSPKKTAGIDFTPAQAAFIEVELMDSTSLFILLAKDGSINRKGDLKTPDKNFFIGITKDNLFDKLIKTIPEDLSSYCGKVHVLADTTKKVNRIKIAFSGSGMDTGLEYYTDEPYHKLPKPILNFLNNAIQITDPWFKSQQEMIRPK